MDSDGVPPDRSLRIAQVNDIAAVGETLARAMRKLGEDAVLIEPRRIRTGLGYPWRAAALPFRAGGIAGAGWSLRRGGFDVVHVHYARLGMLGPMSGRPYTLHIHGTDIRGVRPDSWWGRLTGPWIRRARLVYYATPDLAEWVLPFRDDAIFLPNPIETDRFEPLAAGHPARDGRRDLLVGVRLASIKGLDTIVETLRVLAATRPLTTVTIVAQGEGLAAAREAAGPNTTIAPRVGHDGLADLIRSHRLALGQFAVGAVGNYELECVACGVPMVMRFDRGDAYPEPAPFVTALTGEEAALRVVELLADAAARDRLAEMGVTWVRRNHDAQAIANRVLGDYRRTGQVRT